MSRLPLNGVRVIDLTIWWSGPYATQLLANLGAEVIKIEAIQYVDGFRGAGSGRAGNESNLPEHFWERSPSFNSVNSDKLGATINLNSAKGVEIFKKLVEISDIVAENYTPRVMKNFGLDYLVLKKLNPKIIMVSLPAFGLTGPWKDYPGFAFSIEQMAGIPQLTGLPDGPPKMTGFGLADPIGGVNAMAAVMIALLYRQMTGKGQHIDISQVEGLTCLIGDAIIEYTMNRRIRARSGNNHNLMAPHGYYRCKGNDLWVGIAVSSNEEWSQLCNVMGNPQWCKDNKFSNSMSRCRNKDELDKLIEQWTTQHDHCEVMNALQKVGVAAGAVLTSAELLSDPHLKERRTFQMVDRPIVGPYPYLVPTSSMRFSKFPATIQRPAPLLGEHNDYVFRKLLGMSTEEIQSLINNQIIGTQPLGI